MEFGNQPFQDEIEHLLDVLEVDVTILKHGCVFRVEVMANSSLEFEAPTLSILSVAQVAFPEPFMVP